MTASDIPLVVTTRSSASAHLVLSRAGAVCRWKVPPLVAGQVKVRFPPEVDACNSAPGRNNSAELVTSLVDAPPVTRTVPSASKVAVWLARAMTRFPDEDQLAVAGS